MPLTAKEVITAARDRSPSFAPTGTPDPVLRRFLADYQDQLLGEIAELKADALHEAEEITLPLASFGAGYLIVKPYFRLHGGVVIRKSDGRPEPLRLVEYVDRLERFEQPAAYDQAGTLILLGQAEDWEPYAKIVLDLFPSTASLATLAAEFVLPGKKARPALVAACAAFLASRTEGVDPQRFDAVAAAAEEAYLDEVTGRRRAKVSQIRSVW
jgi:hypothetical protein